jgi:hypothetical protein
VLVLSNIARYIACLKACANRALTATECSSFLSITESQQKHSMLIDLTNFNAKELSFFLFQICTITLKLEDILTQKILSLPEKALKK